MRECKVYTAHLQQGGGGARPLVRKKKRATGLQRRGGYRSLVYPALPCTIRYPPAPQALCPG